MRGKNKLHKSQNAVKLLARHLWMYCLFSGCYIFIRSFYVVWHHFISNKWLMQLMMTSINKPWSDLFPVAVYNWKTDEKQFNTKACVMNRAEEHLLMGYSSRRPHSSSEQDAEATIFTVHQNETREDWKSVIWSDESISAATFRWWDQNLMRTAWKHWSILASINIQAGVGLIVTLHEYFCWSSVYEHGIYWWLLPAGKQSMSQRSNLKMVSWTRLWVHWTQMISTYL